MWIVDSSVFFHWQRDVSPRRLIRSVRVNFDNFIIYYVEEMHPVLDRRTGFTFDPRKVPWPWFLWLLCSLFHSPAQVTNFKKFKLKNREAIFHQHCQNVAKRHSCLEIISAKKHLSLRLCNWCHDDKNDNLIWPWPSTHQAESNGTSTFIVW